MKKTNKLNTNKKRNTYKRKNKKGGNIANKNSQVVNYNNCNIGKPDCFNNPQLPQLGSLPVLPSLSEVIFDGRYCCGNNNAGSNQNGGGYYLSLDSCAPGGLSTVKGYDDCCPPIFKGQLSGNNQTITWNPFQNPYDISQLQGGSKNFCVPYFLTKQQDETGKPRNRTFEYKNKDYILDIPYYKRNQNNINKYKIFMKRTTDKNIDTSNADLGCDDIESENSNFTEEEIENIKKEATKHSVRYALAAVKAGLIKMTPRIKWYQKTGMGRFNNNKHKKSKKK